MPSSSLSVPPLVSVHLISYNQARYIKESLESALGQDYEPLEIIAADDGSTDGTAEIITDFAHRHPTRIVPLVGGPNLGITGNCNRALRACRGKYIAFLGGDDIWLPGKLAQQVQWLEANTNRVLCGHQVEVFYEDKRPSHLHTRHLRTGKGPQLFIRNGPLFCALSVMIRASSLPKHGFDSSIPLVSDGLFFVESLTGGGEYGYVPGVLARYRKHATNVTNNWERCLQDVAAVLKVIKNRYPEYSRDTKVGEANLLLYGHGLKLLELGRPAEGLRYFLRSFATNPTNYKTWIRIVQAILAALKS